MSTHDSKLPQPFAYAKQGPVGVCHIEGRLRISVTVNRFDAKAYGNGQLQRINKQPVWYEFYVVNSRVPVQPRLIVLETTQQHTRRLPEGMSQHHCRLNAVQALPYSHERDGVHYITFTCEMVMLCLVCAPDLQLCTFMFCYTDTHLSLL